MTSHAVTFLSHPDKLFIGGEWLASETDTRLPIVNPATGETVITIAEAREADIDKAIAAADLAFREGPWPRLPLEERLAVLERWAQAIESRLADLILAPTAQIGIPISFSEAVSGSAVKSLRNHVEFARTFCWQEDRPVNGGLARLQREPVGVVAAIVPWNYPSLLGMNKMAPALAAGCTIVVKPSPEAPLDLLIMAECAISSGFPAGVLSILPAGREVGERLVSDRRIDKVSFTGSTAAGKRIGAVCMGRVARLTLELGGKSAAIVLDDMPVAEAVKGIVAHSTLFNGQACMGLTRILVPRARQDEYVAALTHAYRALKVGDPFDKTTAIGPVASPAQADRVQRYIESGKAEGARLATGGTVANCFVEPTIFADVTNNMTIAREEIFGPVLSILPYETIDEAVSIANDSPYGLSGAVFTLDSEKALAIARRIRTGSISQNGIGPQGGMPFGGFKQSGIGREGSPEVFDAYTELQTIYLMQPQAALA
jgi:aldehyde dehydrogenase (NAD+)